MTFKRNIKLFIMSYAYAIIASVLALIVALKINKWLGLFVLAILIFGFIYIMHRIGKKK